MSENDYLAQVMAKQQRVEVDLRAKRASPAANRMALACAEPQQAFEAGALRAHTVGRAAPDMETPAVDVRITGWWRWKTVVVPPNAHVVHTLRGHARPLHIGLGVSFGYDPAKDSFLVVPGTMQTIMINAYCICRELQGLLVQGYVQWIIADFATAYQKLDFTDAEDPMRVVNVQLREQAEAAIKDKVATMGIDEVLSDKQPIIQELTARLRSVAEGAGDSDTGLGLRIVTVQIKEAVVASRQVWENLQKPFRAERARVARLAELEAETVIAARERVADRERGRRARGRDEVHRTRFLGDAAVEGDVGRLRERRLRSAGDRDQLRAEAPDRLEEPQQLVGLAAVRQRDDDIVALNDAEVAVDRFGRMQKEGRRAGARQRRGDLAADDAGLAHAREDDASPAVAEQFDRAREPAVEPLDEREDRVRFGLEHFLREREISHARSPSGS
jgi:hypothetical protein